MRTAFIGILLVSSLTYAGSPPPQATSSPIVTKEIAIFAGGCFWCMQPPFDALKNEGVLSVNVGYTGGTKDQPTYEEVSSGTTGHREAVEVVFNSARISYDKLLSVFWSNVDPTDGAGQFCDKGEPYTSAIFYSNDQQRVAAEASKAAVSKQLKLSAPIVTAILPAKKFYPAEDYHQSYYQKNPVRYKFYRFNCGRDARLKKVWGQSPAH